MEFAYDLRIAGIHIRILAPHPLCLPDSFEPFRFADSGEAYPDCVVVVTFDAPSDPISAIDCVKHFPRRGNTPIVRIESIGRQNTCRLFIPPDMEEQFSQNANWPRLLMPERLFLPYGRVFMHAAGVRLEGRSILFTAPSGGGKSTQAALWESVLGGEIINGDKMVISAADSPPMAYGSPIAGSSLIYKNMGAPLDTVVFLRKALCNRAVLAQGRRALALLYGQTVKSNDDPAFNQALFPHLESILSHTRIVEFDCTPEPAAARYLYEWLKNEPR